MGILVALTLLILVAPRSQGLFIASIQHNWVVTTARIRGGTTCTLHAKEAAEDGECEVYCAPSPDVAYGSIQHCGVLVSDTEASLAFYQEAFGMLDETHLRNPLLPYKGGWLRAGASQIHLMELNNPDPTRGRPEHGGRDRHLALTIGPGSLDIIKQRLEKLGCTFTMSKSGRPALFTRDLDGNALEFMEEELLPQQ